MITYLTRKYLGAFVFPSLLPDAEIGEDEQGYQEGNPAGFQMEIADAS
jgi:hypothetical protein